MKIAIEVTEKELRTLVVNYIKEMFNYGDLQEADVTIEVKSKQNYKSEWEVAAFRARVEKVG